jgi:hypothetical protein
MLQAAPQFTPFQLLDAGRRAEAEGHVDAAFRFYRQTIDQYAYGPEAAEAREGLARLKAGWQPKIWHPNGAPPPAEAVARGGGSVRKGRRGKPPPAGRNPYWVGGALARLVSLFGWLIAVAGLAAPLAFLLLGRPELSLSRPEVSLGMIGVIVSALGLAIFGLLTVALGQATRALFDQANATRELVALERAKSGLDQV